jgi:hypothetical protein
MPLEGSATELYKRLSDKEHTVLRSISKSPAHFGHQLARLSKLGGWREIVSEETHWVGRHPNRQTIWKIAPPAL